jgi:hypothetical protein
MLINVDSHIYDDEQGPSMLTITGVLPAGLLLTADYVTVPNGRMNSPAGDRIGFPPRAGGVRAGASGPSQDAIGSR